MGRMGLTPVVLFIWCRQWMMDGSRADFGSEWTGPCAHYFFGIGLIFVIVALGAPLGAAFEGYPGRFCMLIFLSTLAAMVGTTCYASGGDEGFGEPEHGEGLRCPTKKRVVALGPWWFSTPSASFPGPRVPVPSSISRCPLQPATELTVNISSPSDADRVPAAVTAKLG